MFIDFFIKKTSEVFIRNFLIYGAQFFAEKYLIEHFTKKFFTFTVNIFNNVFFTNTLSYYYYFVQILSNVLYICVILNIIFLI